jgi:hypothetical protein
MSADNSNLPEHDAAWWANYRHRIERAAEPEIEQKNNPAMSTTDQTYTHRCVDATIGPPIGAR